MLRVRSWIKNVFVFVPLIFAKQLFRIDELISVIIGFIIFSLTSSVVYIINDIYDYECDSFHPLKKNRPIASGKISKSLALSIVLVLLLIVSFLIIQNLNTTFALIIGFYIVLNLLYSSILKKMIIVDIFCISLGFMLRVVGGAVLINVVISSWVILATLFLSLFLASMKRRVEFATTENSHIQRSVLKDYSLSFLDQLTSITASGVIISYALYSVSERTISMFGSEYFVGTTIFVVFGIFRYMFLVYRKNKGEDVAEALFSDIPMIINVVLYLITVIIFIYNKPYV